MNEIFKKIIKFFLNPIFFITEVILLFVFFIFTFPLIFKKRRKLKIFFGADPIINNIYWATSLKNKTISADSVVFYSKDSFIAKNSDYDKNIEFHTIKFPRVNNKKILNFYSIINSIFIYYSYDYFWISFNGASLSRSLLGRWEIIWMKICNKKVLVFPFGGDSYVYSEILDESFKHAFLTSHSEQLKNQDKIKKNKNLFFKYLDFFPATITEDKFVPKWHYVRPSFLSIDTDKFKPSNIKKSKSEVIVVHAPNHRGFKGTEIIVNAVNELIQEGLNIKFILLEGIENSKIASYLSQEADILIDQLIAQGYALNALEGMSSELPVIANIEDSNLMNLFRTYSFLDECPIYSANSLNIKDRIRELVLDEALRAELGKKGREFVEKYHSLDVLSDELVMIFNSLESKKSLLNYHLNKKHGRV
jgi:glycosyltransferase involved in cell wall biosynthesis